MSDAMGFFKRWINKENISSVYKRDGVEGVKSYLDTPDAFIITDDESGRVLEAFNKCDDKVLLKEIEKCISTEKR